jgi:cytochrome o ubiquinol oxidase subunit 3
VVDKKMTISNSLHGTTFYTLTGTHGCHVAIGVLWLSLMYVRSFKAAPSVDKTGAWLGKNLIHVVVLIAALLLSLKATLGLVHAFEVNGLTGTAIALFFKAEFLSVAGTLVSVGILIAFARASGPVDFDERHAIDVESMGLYWHFVDIVWIVIFTAVYLLEYLK